MSPFVHRGRLRLGSRQPIPDPLPPDLEGRQFTVHFVGRQPYESLPSYCAAFDLGLIPFVRSPMTEKVNPIKLREYLAAGLPVVASAVSELTRYGDDVLTCSGIDEWMRALEQQLARTDHVAISERMRNESWQNKVATIRSVVDAS